MIDATNCRYDICISPVAIVDNTSWTTNELDTAANGGWDYLEVIFFLGANDIAMTALAVTQSDTAGSGHANITGAVESEADTIEKIVAEAAATRVTERGATRADDRTSEAAMEDRKKEGYF